MFACIDLGSNSFHLLIAEWLDGRHQIVERFSEKVQLGEDLAINSLITPAAFSRGLNCLETFRHALARYPIEHCWAVGTNALRIADNADDFLAAARLKDINIDVISGPEEATLVYAGVNSALPAGDHNRLVIDIGGGSTELVVGCNERIFQLHSMPIGCVSWRDKWFAGAAYEYSDIDQTLRKALSDAEAIFRPIVAQLREQSWLEVFASSGTAKMLSSVCAAAGHQPGVVTLDTLNELRKDVLRVASEPAYPMAGLKNSRRELILPGWSVLFAFMSVAGIDSLKFSPAALREGMLHYMVKASLSGVAPLHALRGH
jgi:exopolyphosphatase / guanosine-5'-triphosphate,3'-diphosphate pyrophosphatase